METSRTNPRAIIALLLAVAGLGAAPASARAQKPRLLFLGISKDGKAHPAAESAVRLRLAGLEVEVVQPQESTEPLCERAECLTTLLSRERADLALTGRILKNERACLATLWFAAGQDKGKMPAAQDIACRPDGKDSELTGSLADGAAGMTDDYLRGKEQPQAIRSSNDSLIDDIKFASDIKRQRTWSAKRKIAAAATGALFAISLAATVTFSTLDGRVAQVGSTSPYPLAPYAAVSGLAAGTSAALLVVLSIK